MARQVVSTDRLMVPIAHFSHGLRVGNTIHLGAAAGTDPDRRLAGTAPGIPDIAAQTDRMYCNLRLGLELLGGSMDDVVRVKGYITDWRDLDSYNEVYARHFRGLMPSRATVGTWGFPLPFAVIEVEVTAIIGGANPRPASGMPHAASAATAVIGVLSGDHHFSAVGGEDRHGNADGMSLQTERALVNLDAALASASMTRRDVVMLTVTLADARDYPAFEEVFRAAFKPPYPARTISGAPLAHPGRLIGIESIAVAGGGRTVEGFGTGRHAAAASPAMLAGEHLYIGAQPGVARDGSIPSGIEAQTRAAWRRIEGILADTGMAIADIVRTNNWLTDWRSYAGFNAAFGEFVAPPFSPRATVIGSLADPRIGIQIEAVGHRAGRDALVLEASPRAALPDATQR